MNDTPNIGRYVASLGVVPPLSKTFDGKTYHLQCILALNWLSILVGYIWWDSHLGLMS